MCDCLIHQVKCAICKIFSAAGLCPNPMPFNQVVHLRTSNPAVNETESWALQSCCCCVSGSLLLTLDWRGWERERKNFPSQARPPLQKWPPGEHDSPLLWETEEQEARCWEMTDLLDGVGLPYLVVVAMQLWTSGLVPFPDSCSPVAHHGRREFP